MKSGPHTPADRPLDTQARPWVIRAAMRADAQRLVDLRKALYRESDFMLYTPEEYSGSRREEKKFIERFVQSPNSHLLVADDGDALIGLLGAMGGRMNKNSHAAHVMLAVREVWWGRGVATSMLDALQVWAADTALQRLSLSVVVENTRAVELYQRQGYTLEGTLRSTFKAADGRLLDELAMSRLL